MVASANGKTKHIERRHLKIRELVKAAVALPINICHRCKHTCNLGCQFVPRLGRGDAVNLLTLWYAGSFATAMFSNSNVKLALNSGSDSMIDVSCRPAL